MSTIASPPTPGQVILAIVVVAVATLVLTTSVTLAVHGRNWLHLITAAGGALVVTGVVGQRVAVTGHPMGPWDSGIQLPIGGVHFNPVTAAGLLSILLGITITYFALALIKASSLLGFAIAIAGLSLCGLLFFKLVRVLSRIQMPKYPGR